MDLEEDADMRKEVNIYKDKSAKAPVITPEVEPDAPIIPLEEMLEEMNLDEEVQGDDITLEERVMKNLVVYNCLCLLEEGGMPLYGREKWDGLYIILQILTIQVILTICA